MKVQFKKFIWFVLWLSLVTLLLRPWRNIIIQDDAVYIDFTLGLMNGDFNSHPLSLAATWPQAIFGILGIKTLPFEPFQSLMLITWILFCISGLILYRISKEQIWLVIAYLSFPLFIQYGSTYLTETYAVFFLLLFFYSYFSRKFLVLLFLSILGLTLQRQTLIAIPALLGLGLFFNDRRLSLQILASCILSLFTYAVLPQGLLQKGYLQWWITHWMDLGVVSTSVTLLTNWIQQFTAMGLFLLPLVHRKIFCHWKGILSLQVLFVLLSYFSPQPPISAGVLFTGYFPKLLSCLFLSFGVWGLAAIFHLFLHSPRRHEVLHLTLGVLAIIAFNGIVLVGDVKYVLPLSVPFFIYAIRETHFTPDILILKFLTPLVFAVSMVTNLYNLDTAEARWASARELESSHPHHSVSAGYGYDLYYYGRRCVELALVKISLAPESERRSLMAARVYGRAPRLYEDGWVSNFLIKPYKFFGKTMHLKENRRPGQDKEPMRVIEYQSLGMTHALAIYENDEIRLPWCQQ